MGVPTLTGIKNSNQAQITKVTSLAPSIIAISVSLVIAVFIVWPKFSEVLRLKTDNKNLEDRAKRLDEKAQVLNSLDRGDLETQLTAANYLLPSDKGVFTLIGQVERAAASTGVLLNRVEVSPGNVTGDEGKSTQNTPPAAPPASGEGVSGGAIAAVRAPRIQLKISISSDYKSFLQFINTLLGNSRVVTVSDLSISSASSGGSGQIRSAFLLDAYWQPTPTDLSSIETPLTELLPSELERLSVVEASPSASANVSVPSVPLGRSDLFAPF